MNITGADLVAMLDAIAERRPSLIDLGLSRVERTLHALGDPHKSLPPVFHIAGTNGKGSTVAYLDSILRASGANVHVFISPHLVRYNERVRLAGSLISDEAFIDVIQRTDEAAGDNPLTFFETLTCAAFLAFAETPADYLVLEVGLGGRLDATNVIDNPLAAVVTPIALDHQHFLGDTIEEIAREKAANFKAAAAEVGAPFYANGLDWMSYPENGRLVFQDTNGLSDLSPPRLVGPHQFQNAGLAVAAIRAAGLDFTEEVLSRGLETAEWAARLQRLRSGPLVEALASDGTSEVWLDGGHNPHAGQAVAAAMAAMEEASPKPLIMISGMQGKKDMTGYYENFAGIVRRVLTVQAGHNGAATPVEVAEAAARGGLEAEPTSGLAEAAKKARQSVSGPARFLISGSLYLAGDVLKDNA